MLIIAHGTYGQASVTDSDFKKLSWLEGTWTRTNVKPGRSGTERWIITGDKELTGWGITMKGADTSFVEKLKLIVKDGNIFYVSDVPENHRPVDFKLTSIDDNGFVCENPAHDFPKKIAYRRDGKTIRATISGDGKEVAFLFERRDD